MDTTLLKGGGVVVLNALVCLSVCGGSLFFFLTHPELQTCAYGTAPGQLWASVQTFQVGPVAAVTLAIHYCYRYH